MKSSKTIYVRLLEEGTDVWRPVEARQISADTFEIVSENPHPEDETREFVHGQKVKCKEHVTPEGTKILAAFALTSMK